MKNKKETNFPDKKFLFSLINHLEKKVDSTQNPYERLLSHSNAAMNWIADYILDESIKWDKQTLDIDMLYLTGTNPKWNDIIIDKCDRSPKKLKELLKNNKSTLNIFKDAKYENLPILVRYEGGKYKVLDGMHRTIGAILLERTKINAFVATHKGNFKPKCEPHVIYDLLKAYHRKVTKDRPGLVGALRYLRRCFVNTDDLLINRFNKSWVPDDEIQEIIEEALKD